MVSAIGALDDTYDRGAAFLLGAEYDTKSVSAFETERPHTGDVVDRFGVVPSRPRSLHCLAMPTRPVIAPLLRVALAALVVAIAASAWDLLARQVPSSPWHVVGYPSAIVRLETRAWIESALLFAIAPRALDRGFVRAALATALAAGGTVLSIVSLAISARTGVLANQLRDTTTFASVLLATRLAGDGLLLAALVITLRSAFGTATRDASE
jgi:hypothetical protein